MKRQAVRKTNEIFKYLSFVLIFIFSLLIPVVIQKAISIKNVECKSQFGDCPNIILNSFNLRLPKNYKDTKIGIERALAENYLVEGYLISYKLFDKVRVDLVLKTPYFAAIDNSGQIYTLDKDGLVLSKTDSTDLPKLKVLSYPFESGKNINPNVLFGLNILRKVGFLYTITEANLLQDELNILLSDGILVRFPLDGDLDVLVGSLRLIFSRLNDESKGIKMSDIKEVDLRFKNAILRKI